MRVNSRRHLPCHLYLDQGYMWLHEMNKFVMSGFRPRPSLSLSNVICRDTKTTESKCVWHFLFFWHHLSSCNFVRKTGGYPDDDLRKKKKKKKKVPICNLFPGPVVTHCSLITNAIVLRDVRNNPYIQSRYQGGFH